MKNFSEEQINELENGADFSNNQWGKFIAGCAGCFVFVSWIGILTANFIFFSKMEEPGIDKFFPTGNVNSIGSLMTMLAPTRITKKDNAYISDLFGSYVKKPSEGGESDNDYETIDYIRETFFLNRFKNALYGMSESLPEYLSNGNIDAWVLYLKQRQSLIGRTLIASYISSMYILRKVLEFTEYVKISPFRFVIFLLTTCFVFMGPYFTGNILMGAAKGESQGLFKGFTNIISGLFIFICFCQAFRMKGQDEVATAPEGKAANIFRQLGMLFLDAVIIFPMVAVPLSLFTGWVLTLEFLLMFIIPTAGLFYDHAKVFETMNESRIFIGGVFAFLCLGLARQFLNSSIVSGMSALFFVMVLYYILIWIRDFFKSLKKKNQQ